jgi:hypothetical protein
LDESARICPAPVTIDDSILSWKVGMWFDEKRFEQTFRSGLGTMS